jgi:hypothetical protein
MTIRQNLSKVNSKPSTNVLSRSSAEGGFPHAMLGIEALDLAQLDLGVLGPVRGFAPRPVISPAEDQVMRPA